MRLLQKLEEDGENPEYIFAEPRVGTGWRRGSSRTANGMTVGSVANDPANFTGQFPRCLRHTPSI